MDGLLAMNILCNAALINQRVLQLLQCLAAGTPITIPVPDSSKLVEAVAADAQKCNDNTDKAWLDNKSSSINSDTDTNRVYPSANATQVATLNMLGMQPTFREPSPKDSDDQQKDDEEEDSIERYSTLSITTQALIETESIPDIMASSQSTLLQSELRLSNIDSLDLFKNSSGGQTFKPSTNEVLEESSSGHHTDDHPDRGKKKVGQKRVTLGNANLLEHHPSSPAIERSSPTIDDDIVSQSSSCGGNSIDRVELLDDRFEFKAKIVTLSIPPPRNDSSCTHYTHSIAPFSWAAGAPGSQVPPSTIFCESIRSETSTVDTAVTVSTPALQSAYSYTSWAGIIQIAYTLNMADIVLHSMDSNIQRMALLGCEENQTSQYSLAQLASYGEQLELSTGMCVYTWKFSRSVLICFVQFSSHIVVY